MKKSLVVLSAIAAISAQAGTINLSTIQLSCPDKLEGVIYDLAIGQNEHSDQRTRSILTYDELVDFAFAKINKSKNFKIELMKQLAKVRSGDHYKFVDYALDNTPIINVKKYRICSDSDQLPKAETIVKAHATSRYSYSSRADTITYPTVFTVDRKLYDETSTMNRFAIDLKVALGMTTMKIASSPDTFSVRRLTSLLLTDGDAGQERAIQLAQVSENIILKQAIKIVSDRVTVSTNFTEYKANIENHNATLKNGIEVELELTRDQFLPFQYIQNAKIIARHRSARVEPIEGYIAIGGGIVAGLGAGTGILANIDEEMYHYGSKSKLRNPANGMMISGATIAVGAGLSHLVRNIIIPSIKNIPLKKMLSLIGASHKCIIGKICDGETGDVLNKAILKMELDQSGTTVVDVAKTVLSITEVNGFSAEKSKFLNYKKSLELIKKEL